jgi:phage terminase large subunit
MLSMGDSKEEALNKRLGKIIESFRYDALAFVRHVIRPKTISKDQEAFLNAVSQYEARVSVVSGTTTGKTATLAWVILWILSTRGKAKIPVTSTTEKQTINVLWPEIALWHKEMIPEFRDRIMVSKERAYVIGKESIVWAYPLVSRPESVEGFQGLHNPNLVIIADEASGIPQVIFDAMRGSVSTPGAKWIVAGNGVRASGPFYDSHHKTKEFWTCLSFSSLDSPFCSKDYCASVAAEYGIDSNMYRVRVLGKFPKADDDTLIPFDWVEAALDRNVVPMPDSPRIAGLDPAGSGKDATGFLIRQDKRFSHIQRWKGMDTMGIVGKVVQLWKEKAFDKIMVDAIGIGSGVASRLIENGVPTGAINVAMSAITERERCHMLRDELWWKMRAMMENQLCGVVTEGSKPEDVDALVHELSTPKYKLNSAGKVVVENKDSLRKADRLGRSPDLADAACLTLAEGVIVENAYESSGSRVVVPMADAWVW